MARIRASEEGGEPVLGAHVRVTAIDGHGETMDGSSDEAGLCELEGVLPNLYVVRVESAVHGEEEVTAMLPGSVSVVLRPGAILLVTVDGGDARAPSGEWLSAFHATTGKACSRPLTGIADPTISLGTWPVGLVRVQVMGPSGPLSKRESVSMPARGERRLTLSMEQPRGVPVLLRDSRGELLDDWTMDIDVYRGMAPPLHLHSSDGKCHVPLMPGRYGVRAASPGHGVLYAYLQVPASAGQLNAIELALPAAVPLICHVTGASSGTVDLYFVGSLGTRVIKPQKRRRQAPIEEDRVSRYDATLGGLPPSYYLVASVPLQGGVAVVPEVPCEARLMLVVRGQARSRPIYLDSGQSPLTVSVDAVPAGTLRATLQGPDDVLTSRFAYVSVERAMGTRWEHVCVLVPTASHDVVLEGLEAGLRYRLTVRAGALRGDLEVTGSGADMERAVPLRLPMGQRRIVRVTEQDGKPVAGASVGWHRSAWDTVWGLTDSSGQALLDVESDGGDSITVKRVGFHSATVAEVPTNGTVGVTLSRLSVLVVDCSAAPTDRPVTISIYRLGPNGRRRVAQETCHAGPGSVIRFETLAPGPHEVESLIRGAEAPAAVTPVTLVAGSTVTVAVGFGG